MLNLQACWRIVVASMIAALLTGSVAAAPCAKSELEAVTFFVDAYAGAAANPADFVQPRSLSDYRSRLAQLFDDRFAPASAAWRAKVLGEDWTPTRIREATDAELVGAYFAHAASIRPAVTISDIKIVRADEDFPGAAPLRVTFQVESAGTAHAGGAYLDTEAVEGCWKVTMPLQAWVQIDKVASALKSTRPVPERVSERGHRMKLRVLAASRKPVAGAWPLAGWEQKVWVDRTPLITEANVTGASAWWTCPNGMGAEAAGIVLTLDDRAAAAFARLPQRHDFPMIAIVVDDKVLSVPLVKGVLGTSLELCDQQDSLEQAEAVAASLRGEGL